MTETIEARKAGERSLRVALDTSFAGVNETGVGIYSRRIAQGLRRRERDGNLELACLGPSCRADHRGLLLGGLYQEWPTYTQLFLPLRLARYRPHVIHSTSHLGPVWGPGRRVVTVHDLIFLRYPEDYNRVWLAITRALLPVVIRRAAAIIADSATTARDLRHTYRTSAGKIRVIYPGVDEKFRRSVSLEAIKYVRARHDLGESPYILLMGPWVRRKNLEVVIEAFPRVLSRQPEAQLVITGKPAPGMQSAEVVAALRRLPDDARTQVRTVGHLTDDSLVALMQGAAVLTYPSHYEGFGLPPVEAMASGVPVIISGARVLAEVTGGAALVAAAGRPEQWAESIQAVLSNPLLAARLVEEGRRRSSQFSWERCVRETVKLYRSVARASAPA